MTSERRVRMMPLSEGRIVDTARKQERRLGDMDRQQATNFPLSSVE